MSYYTGGVAEDIVCDTTAAATEYVIYTDRVGGRFYVPAGSSITAITWYDAPKYDDTFLASCDQFGDAITQTVAAGYSYEVPTALAGAGAIKAVVDAAGTLDFALKG